MPALYLILACAFWGLSFPVIRALHLEQGSRLPGAESGFLTVWLQVARFGLASLMLLPFALRGGGPTRNELRQGLWLALWGGLGMAAQADGLAYTDASTSAFLTQAHCVFLPLIACAKLRRRPTARTLAATLMVLAGGAVLSGVSPATPKIGRGELETLIAAGFFTLQILTLENPSYRGNRSTPVTLIMCAGITLLFLPFTVIAAPSPGMLISAGASWSVLGLVFVLAAFCSVGAFLLMNHWQPRINAIEAGLLYTSEPVFAALYALILPAWIARLAGFHYPNETLTGSLLLGGSLVLAANVLIQLRRRRPHPPGLAPVP